MNWLFPWVTGEDRLIAGLNLQQTLILTAPLILTGLAVAFAFRAGLFNIGGQGQYLVGSFAAVYVGSSLDGLPALLHVVLAIVAGCVVGGLWAGIAGLLKATTGANEVISTIMLNWTASTWACTCSSSAGRCRARTRRSSRSRSPTTSSRAPGCPCSGATPSCRACTSASSSRWSSPRCSGCC